MVWLLGAAAVAVGAVCGPILLDSEEPFCARLVASGPLLIFTLKAMSFLTER